MPFSHVLTYFDVSEFYDYKFILWSIYALACVRDFESTMTHYDHRFKSWIKLVAHFVDQLETLLDK